MAGLLQTGTLVNGQWTTTNVDINTVLERHKERKQDESQSEQEKPPVFGLLTQSVIDGSMIHWILTAQIRSPEHYDIVFIRDQAVQIFHLGIEGQLHNIARKADFGSRIRNVGVVDMRVVGHKARRDLVLDLYVKKEDGDISMPDAFASKPLPPHFLVLALESGDLVFLFANDSGTKVEFITSRHKTTTSMPSGEPGAHLVFDPSSRYMALGTHSSMRIYALNSKEEISAQYARGDPLCLISSEWDIPIDGIILHVKFLYPAPNDPDHMILLLLVANSESTVMIVYEWEAGQNLLALRSNNIGGHKLHPNYRIPLLVIPLTIKSAFLLVFPKSITECTNILLGPPDYLDVPIEDLKVSENHLGLDMPLWVSWAGSSQVQSNLVTYNEIYIAREDGAILSVKISDQSPGGYIKAQAVVGSLDCRIGTAFTGIQLPLPDSKFFIVAGDACNGGVYHVVGGSNPVKTDTIANWSPMLDFVTTARAQQDEDFPHDALEPQKRRRLAVDEPDKIYVCTGRGSCGAVSEMRYGHEARIRFDAPGLDFTTQKSWVLPVVLENLAFSQSNLFLSSSLLLMSVGSGSVLLHIADDTNEIEEIDQDKTWLDLDSRTLAAAACNGVYVQITESSILASGHPPYFESVSPIIHRENPAQPNVIIVAGIYEAEFVVIVSQDENSNLQVSGLHVRHDQTTDDLVLDSSLTSLIEVEPLTGSFPLSGYPNSISIIRQSDENLYAIVCAGGLNGDLSLDTNPTKKSASQLAIFEIKDGRELVEIDPRIHNWTLFENGLPDALLEACVDIVNLREIGRHRSHPQLVLAGYRSGLLIMRRYEKHSDGGIRELGFSQYLMGSTAVTFKSDPTSPNAVFIRCDSKLWRVTYDSYSHADPALNRLWFTAAEDSLHYQPSVDTLSVLPHRLLLTSGKRLLIAFVDSEVKPVPRSMPVQGAPNRLLYSHHLSKIIIAMTIEGRSALAFLDPESGKLYNRHQTSFGRVCRFPPGLGNVGEKILSLVEWRRKDLDMRHDLLLVGTSEGRLIIYSAEFSDFSKKRSLRWIIHIKERYDSPVSAIATCKNTIFLCVGRTVRWVSLDKMKKETLLIHAEYNLPSSAVSVTVDGHWISVLTVKHSLIKLLLVDKRQHPNLSDYHGQLLHQLSDEHSRDSIDQFPLLIDPSGPTYKDSSIVMIADKDCTVAGLWGTKLARTLLTDYETIFEAELQFSILKFRAGRVRPSWDKTYRRGCLTVPSHRGGEVLGIGINGSITHFTVLTEQVWRLLKFLQDLVYQSRVASSAVSDSNYWGIKSDPRSKHIDGELLRPLLNYHTLESLLVREQSKSQNKPDNWAFKEFRNHLRGIENTGLVHSKEETFEDCLQDAYQILAHLLRPVV